jgi:hypothetical protein
VHGKLAVEQQSSVLVEDAFLACLGVVDNHSIDWDILVAIGKLHIDSSVADVADVVLAAEDGHKGGKNKKLDLRFE